MAELNPVHLTATATSVTVNAAFLQEIKEVNHHLWRLLADTRRLCCKPSSVRAHGRCLVDMLRSLRDELAMHFSLEEYFGYFDDPIEVAPRLCERANQLRSEHELLYQQICFITDQAESFLYERGRRSRMRRVVALRFCAFYDQLKAHESRENDLILDAFDDDIGVGD